VSTISGTAQRSRSVARTGCARGLGPRGPRSHTSVAYLGRIAVASLLPAHLKWKAFFHRQAANPDYLHHGDVVELRVATPDGAIDLGRQRTILKEAS
jgi:hypothetical protein